MRKPGNKGPRNTGNPRTQKSIKARKPVKQTIGNQEIEKPGNWDKHKTRTQQAKKKKETRKSRKTERRKAIKAGKQNTGIIF